MSMNYLSMGCEKKANHCHYERSYAQVVKAGPSSMLLLGFLRKG
jgi:hypothetical protein